MAQAEDRPTCRQHEHHQVQEVSQCSQEENALRKMLGGLAWRAIFLLVPGFIRGEIHADTSGLSPLSQVLFRKETTIDTRL